MTHGLRMALVVMTAVGFTPALPWAAEPAQVTDPDGVVLGVTACDAAIRQLVGASRARCDALTPSDGANVEDSLAIWSSVKKTPIGQGRDRDACLKLHAFLETEGLKRLADWRPEIAPSDAGCALAPEFDKTFRDAFELDQDAPLDLKALGARTCPFHRYFTLFELPFVGSVANAVVCDGGKAAFRSKIVEADSARIEAGLDRQYGKARKTWVRVASFALPGQGETEAFLVYRLRRVGKTQVLSVNRGVNNGPRVFTVDDLDEHLLLKKSAIAKTVSPGQLVPSGRTVVYFFTDGVAAANAANRKIYEGLRAKAGRQGRKT